MPKLWKQFILLCFVFAISSCGTSVRKVNVSAPGKSTEKTDFITSTPFDLRGDAAVALMTAMKGEDITDEVGYITRQGIYNGRLQNGCSLVSVIRTQWGKKGSSVMNYIVCKGKIEKSISSTNATIPDSVRSYVVRVFRDMKKSRVTSVRVERSGFLIEGKRQNKLCKMKVLHGIKLVYYAVFECP